MNEGRDEKKWLEDMSDGKEALRGGGNKEGDKGRRD